MEMGRPASDTMPSCDELDAIKKRKEIEKLDIDIANAKLIVRYEKHKTLAALMVPLMASLTVLGTVYIGFKQISAKSIADEDVNWRQTVYLINETKPEDLGRKHIGTLLKPFLQMERYRPQQSM